MRIASLARVIAALAILALATLAAGYGVVASRMSRADAAPAVENRALEGRRPPARVQPRSRRSAPTRDAVKKQEAPKGGTWYVVCVHHLGGFCSLREFNFDTAMVHAELHRKQSGHLDAGVSAACPY